MLDKSIKSTNCLKINPSSYIFYFILSKYNFTFSPRIFLQDVFMIPESMPLDAANIAVIIRRGYSRIPVYKVII